LDAIDRRILVENSLNEFESVYVQAHGDPAAISWADLVPNPNLVRWLDANAIDAAGKRALVVGCGLGDDAEELARRGFETTAFDVSPTAIRWCRRRFPGSNVEYVAADLFRIPDAWGESFDFVLESYTLQVLPAELRRQAIPAIATLVAPGGTLLLIARGRDGDESPGNSPWQLTRKELGDFISHGLVERTFQDFMDDESPPVRRFVITYQRR
jgi:SAM-dependent methyltransferase